MRKIVFVLFSLVVFIFLGCNSTSACTGAKQAAMGHAGVAIADNAHAVYWNQALLPLLKSAQISYTARLGGNDKYRYDHVVSAVTPIKKFGVGLQYINSETYSSGYERVDLHASRREYWEWLIFGAGFKIYDDHDYIFSLGTAVRPIWVHYDSQITARSDTGSYIFKSGYQKLFWQHDLSLIAEKRNFFQNGDILRLACLWQDIPRNVRPGASYSFLLKRVTATLSAEIYDARNFFDCRDLQFGAEITIGNFNFRGGLSTRPNYSFGVGYKVSDNIRIDFSALSLKTSLVEVGFSF